MFKTPADAPLSLPRYFWVLLRLDLLSSAFTFTVPLLAPLLMKFGGLTTGQAAWVQCGTFFATGVFQPYLGHLIDQGRYTALLWIAGVSFSAGTLALIHGMHTVHWLIFGALTVFLGLNTLNTLYFRALVGGVDDKDVPYATGRHYRNHNLGFCVASVLAYFFLSTHRVPLLYADLVTTLVVAILGLAYVLRADPAFRPEEGAAAPKALPWHLIFQKPRFLVGVCLIWVCIFIHTSVLPLVFEKLGHDSVRWTAILLATNTVVVVLFTGRLSKLLGTLSENSVLHGAMWIYCVQGLTPYFLSEAGLVATTLVWTVGEILSALVLSAMVYRVFPKSHSGLASGVLVGTRSVGLILSPLLGLAVLPLPRAVFFLIIGGTGILSYWLVRPELKRAL